MAQPTTTPKIEELRARLKGDPKTRQFFPLAEELRKIDRHDEAEKVLREGLTHHPTYLSAWISLGRVLSEAERHPQAVEVLEKALTLDGGNVVAARLLAEAYLALGQKIDAIKKFKLVNALMPNDEEIEAQIDALDRELNPEKYGVPPPAAPPPAPAAEPVAEASPAAPPPAPVPEPAAEPVAEASPSPAEAPAVADEPPSPFVEPPTPFVEPPTPFIEPPTPLDAPRETHDVFVMPAAAEGQAAASHDDSDVFSMGEAPSVTEPPASAKPSPEETFPFPPSPKFELPAEAEENLWSAPSAPEPEESAESPFADLPPAPPSAPAFEAPAFEMDEPSPFSAAPMTPAADESPFEEPTVAPPPADDLTTTVTMADLYAKQGHYDQARDIYQRMLERDPMNGDLRRKLDALPIAFPQPAAAAPAEESGRSETVHRLESWLTKVKKDDRRV